MKGRSEVFIILIF